jgi:hypothetical protein
MFEILSDSSALVIIEIGIVLNGEYFEAGDCDPV